MSQRADGIPTPPARTIIPVAGEDHEALLISYDLNKPGQNYDKLYAKIKELRTWWHYLDSTWIVVSALTPSQAFAWDWLSKHV